MRNGSVRMRSILRRPRGAPVYLHLIAELKRRRVFRALVGYGIAAFAILQIVEPVMHGLRWPEVTLSYVVVALAIGRSEEHTSELQSRLHLVCRLLLAQKYS